MSKHPLRKAQWINRAFEALFSMSLTMLSGNSLADETCMSPWMTKITGQEDFVYVWTLGMKGLGDEQDKLVTVGMAIASYERIWCPQALRQSN